jgi:hypothetical protein
MRDERLNKQEDKMKRERYEEKLETKQRGNTLQGKYHLCIPFLGFARLPISTSMCL